MKTNLTGKFPLPGTQVSVAKGTATVVASVYYYDDERGNAYTLLLLNPTVPYFTVAIAEPRDGEYILTHRESHLNIVPAVAAYVQCGGDY